MARSLLRHDGMAATRISLCMIVRDEGALLPRCLKSAAPLVDEILVVDTGSSDDTRSKARALGARVLSRDWSDDFAEARNAALAEATGDYVLVLDADEWIERGIGGAELRRRIEVGGEEAYTVELVDHLDGDGLRRSTRTRLFRNRPEHRFEGAVGERIDRAIARRLGRLELDPPPCGLVVGHDGFARSSRESSGRGRRLVDLLRRRLVASYGDALSRFFLARERTPMLHGRAIPGAHVAEALVHWEWLADHPGSLPPAFAADAARLHAAALLAEGRAAEADAVLSDRCDVGTACDLLRVDADLAAAAEHPDRALRALERATRCVDRTDVPEEPSLTGPVARARVAEASLRLGRHAAARRTLDEASCMPGGGASVWSVRAALELAEGRKAEALAALLEGLRADPSDPWAWAAFGELLLAQSDPVSAGEAFHRAASLAPQWDRAERGLKTVAG